VHFIGKDIIYFHTLFWPAMLKFAGTPYKVPDNVYVHGFITVSGEKMSKSRGTGIDPLKYLELGMNAEWLRYYIAAKLNARVEDIDFNPDDFLPGQQRPGRQVRQHRQPRGELHHEALRRRARVRQRFARGLGPAVRRRTRWPS
jgi:leucyl-tRNA synthetase